jgi:hypothetical protein
MSEETPTANPPLSAEEQTAVAKLTDADLQAINAAILANCKREWLKVARVVTDTEKALATHFPELSHIFYTVRLAELVKEKHLESQGNLAHIRFSEVRLAG